MTLIGVVREAWQALLMYVTADLRLPAAQLPAGRDLPVELLLRAVEVQAEISAQLGTFMMLQVRCCDCMLRRADNAPPCPPC